MPDGQTGETSSFGLPADRELMPLRSRLMAREQTFLDASLVKSLRLAAPTEGALLFAAFQVLLYRLTGQERFAVSAGTAGTAVFEGPGGSAAFGMSAPIRCQVTGSDAFGSVVSAAAAGLAADTPAALALSSAGPGDLQPPLCFDAGDLLVIAAPAAGPLALICEYDTARFEPATIRQWLGGFNLVLQAGTENPERPVSTLPWRPGPELVSPARDTSTAGPAIASRNDTGPCRLSCSQQRTWLRETLDPLQQVGHNLPCAWRLSGPLEGAALERTVNLILRRHDVLRTRIVLRDDEPLQEAVAEATVELVKIDLTGLAPEARAGAFLALCDRDSGTPHDLSRAPLIRGSLIRMEDDQHILLMVPHSLVWDGRSSELFLGELASLYPAAMNAPIPLPDLANTYRDFARWQRQWLETGEAAAQRAWWREQLGGPQPLLDLPTDWPRPERPTWAAIHATASLPSPLRDALTAVGRQYGASLRAVLHAALCVVLHRVSGQEDLMVGVAVDGRSRPETEDLIGPFLNHQVLRSRLESSTRFSDLLTQCRTATLDARRRRDLPLEALDVRAPNLRAFFSFEDVRQRPARVGAANVTTIPLLPPLVAADVRLAVTETRDGLTLVWTCSAELFEARTADRLLERLDMVLAAAVRDPGARIADLDIIGANEQALLQEFREPAAPGHGQVCAHTWIERHAARAPHDAALVFGDEVLGYAALDQQATAVAHALSVRGVGPGTPVGIYLSRSADLVTSVLGIFKVGAVCVPLDPADPPARVTRILNDSHAVLILTDTGRRRQLPATTLPIVCVDDAGPGRAGPLTSLRGPESPDSIACLLYACEASEPQPTRLTHRSLSALLDGLRRELSLTGEDVALAISPPSLDVSLIELLAPLSASGCVVIADDDVALEPERLTEAVGRSAATVMIAPASVWEDLLGAVGATWPRLKAVCFGAVPTRALLAELGARTGAAWLAHGSTPAAVWTTLHHLTERDSGAMLGRPLGHVALRVVDGIGRDAPIGVAGELLARTGGHTEPWTRTGEQARWRASGEVELVGGCARHAYVDGFRIDLDDVARAIRRHAAVEDAEVVLESGSAPERLVACVAPRAGAAYSVGELRRELRRTVPAAMVPRSFVEVGSIPRAPDGRALFRPADAVPPGPVRAQVAPETATETILAAMWEEALATPHVCVHDNFIGLGGHSLLCLQLLDRIEAKTGYRVSPRQLALDSLRQVAAQIDAQVEGDREAAKPARRAAGTVLRGLRRLEPGSA